MAAEGWDTGEGRGFLIGPGVARAAAGRPWERRPGDPPHRPLRIFTLDPSVSRLEGGETVVPVPYEVLEGADRGRVFRGRIFEVDPRDGGNGVEYEALDLDDRGVLLRDGRAPSPSDPLFHQQMVYAVASLAYSTFRQALGRDLAWGFDRPGADGATRLMLRPYATVAHNAWYDKEAGEIAFGYYRAERGGAERTPAGGWVFTSLAHDVVVHEVTHALLDGLRAAFVVPTGPDVSAFHEGLADLVAVLQRFTYADVVRGALASARGRLEDASLLTDLARQFGQTVGEKRALRSAIDPSGARLYRPDLEPHELGSVLVSAVFGAFTAVFRRKVARYVRLATGGSGELPPGELPADLQAVLAERASALAAQFLAICIRAVDYCPPVDIELGEFLRAAITADHDLVPDDPWAYREAWIDAFRRREVYPRGVGFLSEDALLWRPPTRPVPPIPALGFDLLRFDGDPARPAGADELRRQARALGAFVTRPDHLAVFGLAAPGEPRLGSDAVTLPCVQSIRSLRRVGPDGQVVFDLVAEVTQERRVAATTDMPGFDFLGGATVIIGPTGGIRYVVSKSVLNEERLERQREYLRSDGGRALWTARDGRLEPAPQPFRIMHGPRPAGA